MVYNFKYHLDLVRSIFLSSSILKIWEKIKKIFLRIIKRLFFKIVKINDKILKQLGMYIYFSHAM